MGARIFKYLATILLLSSMVLAKQRPAIDPKTGLFIGTIDDFGKYDNRIVQA